MILFRSNPLFLKIKKESIFNSCINDFSIDHPVPGAGKLEDTNVPLYIPLQTTLALLDEVTVYRRMDGRQTRPERHVES